MKKSKKKKADLSSFLSRPWSELREGGKMRGPGNDVCAWPDSRAFCDIIELFCDVMSAQNVLKFCRKPEV